MTEAQAVDIINLLFYIGCVASFGFGALMGVQR